MQKNKIELKIKHLNRTEVTEFPFKKLSHLNLNSSQRGSRSSSGGTTTPISVGKTTLPFSKTDLLSKAVQQTFLHPLSTASVSSTNDLKDKGEFIDPLTEFLVNKETAAFKPAKTANIESWSSRKTKLLTNSMASCASQAGERLTFYSSFLGELVSSATSSTSSNRYDETYDDLNETETMRRETNLTPPEYKNRIEALNSLLVKFWKQEERVKSLKIATQCAGLLAIDTEIATNFYAAKFILITDLLDNFADLVYNRIRAQIDSSSSNRPNSVFIASETARNWFRKVSEIHQLVPRVFLELALLKCYDFIDDCNFKYERTLLRLVRSVRGIADPLVAVYARCYLSRIAIALDSKLLDDGDDKRPFCENLFDFYLTLNPEYQAYHRRQQRRIAAATVADGEDFLPRSLQGQLPQSAVIEPALDFVTATAVEMGRRRSRSSSSIHSNEVDDETLETILDNYEQNSAAAAAAAVSAVAKSNGFVLNCLLRHLPQRFVADRVFVVFDLLLQLLPMPALSHSNGIKNSSGGDNNGGSSSPTISKLIETIASCLVQFRPDRDKRPHILHRFYAIVDTAAAVSSAADRMRCFDSFSDFICLYYTSAEIGELLRRVFELAKSDTITDSLDAPIKSIILKILKNVSFRSFLKLDLIYEIIKLIRTPTLVYDVNRAIISEFAKQLDLEVEEDSELSRNLLNACQQLHDSLTIFSSNDERKQIDQFVANFVARIRFVPNWPIERQLHFYLECRQKFANFDHVFAQLVHSVNKLCAQTVLKQVISESDNGDGDSTEQETIRSFLKACLTFCSITIVSIACTFTKLKLFLLTAQVALKSHHYVHVDLCLNSIFELLPEIQQSDTIANKTILNDEILISFLRNVLSFLRIVPESPEENSTLVFVKKFVEFIRNFKNENDQSKTTTKAILYLNVLDLLAALAQSNCSLRAEDKENPNSMAMNQYFNETDAENYEKALDEMAVQVVEQVIRELNDLSKLEMREKQAILSFELFLRIALYADLEHEPKIGKLRDLAATLWSFCRQFPFDNQLLVTKIFDSIALLSKHFKSD